jgi:RNA polymerase sigma-54 factor
LPFGINIADKLPVKLYLFGIGIIMYQIQRQSTRHQITAHLAQTMTLLTKSVEELSEEIENELASNPALELDEEIRCPTCNRTIPSNGLCPNCTNPKSMDPDETVVFVSPRSDFINHIDTQNDEENTDEQMAVMVEELPAVILKQIANVLAIEDRPIAAYLLNQLNEDGLLTIDFEELATYFHVSIDRIRNIQKLIQHADPLGVGSSSPKDALLVQLEFLSEQRQIPQGVNEIIQHGFVLLEHANYREITKQLKFPTETVKNAVGFIKNNLNPYPARANWGTIRQPDSFDRRHFLYPDILINHLNNDLNKPLMVEIILPVRGTLKLNQLFKDNLKQAEPDSREEMKEDLEKASLFIKCIQQRNNTMQRLVERVITVQKEFVKRGERYMKPLTRAQIAKELEVHESTVSRAVSNKSIKMPSGEVIPLAKFFERNLNVRAVMQEIIENETKPLSDSQIQKLLSKQGIKIARRTVAKYRSLDGQLPAHLRKTSK